MSRRIRRVGAGVVVALAIGLAALAAGPRARPAFDLVSSYPPDRATVAEAPAEIELIFTTPVDPDRSYLSIVDQIGAASAVGRPVLVAPGRLRQPVQVAAAGEVTIAYHVTSADGAEAAGVLRFTARAGAAAEPGGRSSGLPSSGVPSGLPSSGVPSSGVAAGHDHGVDPVSAALLALDGLVALAVVVLLAVRPGPSAPRPRARRARTTTRL